MVGLPPPWVLGLRFQALSIQFSRHKFASRTEDRRLLEARETMSVKPRGPWGGGWSVLFFPSERTLSSSQMGASLLPRMPLTAAELSSVCWWHLT